MKQLSLRVPGFDAGGPIATSPNLKVEFTDLASVVSGFLNVFFYIAGFLMLFWFIWGVFQYIMAGGNKESLAKARSRLTWAIMGFILLVASFAISLYARNIFPQEFNNKNKGATTVSIPCTGEQKMRAECLQDEVCNVVNKLPKCELITK